VQTGWTQLVLRAFTSVTLAAYRVAQAGDTGSNLPTIATQPISASDAYLFEISSQNATPIGVSGSRLALADGTTNTETGPSITPADNNSLIFTAFTADGLTGAAGPGVTYATSPATTTTLDTDGTGTQTGLTAAHSILATAGAINGTFATTGTFAAGADGFYPMISFAIVPGAAPPPSTTGPAGFFPRTFGFHRRLGSR
jgi:hypothetical protein